MRGGKEKAMVELMKAMIADGKRVVMTTATAEARARLIWTYKLPKDSVMFRQVSVVPMAP